MSYCAFLSPFLSWPSGGATLRFHVTSDVGHTVRRRHVALQYVALRCVACELGCSMLRVMGVERAPATAATLGQA